MSTATREATQSPCAACPWRTANQGKRHADGWYTTGNLRRLWSGLRTGEAPGMTCHPTDPNNPVSEQAVADGYRPAPDHAETRECAGSVMLMQRELMRFQSITNAGGSFADYRRGNPGAMTREALLAFAFRAQGAPSFMTGLTDVPMRRDHDLTEPVSRPGAAADLWQVSA